ncbi:uncharacterized protein [Linepithema humile]|uniref:uncharacterized protein n=1 Tax=Linepithema humile TaxID=83485 RepID=UPI00351E9868
MRAVRLFLTACAARALHFIVFCSFTQTTCTFFFTFLFQVFFDFFFAMPKHKAKKKYSRHSREKRSRDSYDRGRDIHKFSRSRSRVHSPAHGSRYRRRQAHSSADSRSSRDTSIGRSRSRDGLYEMLDHIRALVSSREGNHNLNFRRTKEVRSPLHDATQVEEDSASVLVDSLTSPQSIKGPTVIINDRGVVPGMSSCLVAEVRDEDVPSAHSGSFIAPPTVESAEPPLLTIDSEAQTLAKELFGEVNAPTIPSTWNQTVLNSIQSDSRTGLSQDIRAHLLSKYEVKEALANLIPPRLNKKLAAVLTPSVVKRDEYQFLAQTQVSACLNAFGSGVSILLQPEIAEGLNSALRSALTFFSEGIHLLADNQISLRRSKPLRLARKQGARYQNLYLRWERNHYNPFASIHNSESSLTIQKHANRETRGLLLAHMRLAGQEIAFPRAAPIEPSLDLGQVAAPKRDCLVREAIQGYRIPFILPPPARFSLAEPKFSPADATLCDREIERLRSKGAVAPVEPHVFQFLSPFFLIDKSSGGKRFILNLRDLNKYIVPPHFKLEDWRTVIRLMLPGFHMATLDLEDAYLLVPIYENHRRFLRFQWRNVTYEFSALPFGLSTAPYIFTKILRPVVTFLRNQGYQSVVYLDDFLLLGSSADECRANILASVNLLQSLGFVINFSKFYLDPSPRYVAFEKWLALSDHSSPEIFSDASLNGWGATCGDLRTHGWWSESDQVHHINALELKAAFHGLRCFAADLRDCDILLRVDNTTALAYINKFGSIQFPHLSAIAKEIWQWCEDRNIFIFASYIASIENSIADTESRIADPDTEWSLSEGAFQEVLKTFGPFNVDLFASLINNKCDSYVSWFPDPGSIAVDAFTLSWRDFSFYAFPPFILLPRVLRKIVEDEATGTDPTSIVENVFPGGREIIREAFKERLVPPGAIPALLASLSEATIKQYSYPLRIWWNFCQRHQTPLFSPSVSQMLEFLAHELPHISSFSSLNTMRSAVSLISNNEIGNHPMVRRFCKGVAVLKPPRPRYDYVWDPAPVLSKLALIYPYESLSLEIITKKLALLIALGSGHRAQTFASIRLSQVSLKEKLIIRIPDRIKTSAPERYQPLLCFARFQDHDNLCIVLLMEHYIDRTRGLRSPSCDSLFISYRKPFKAVSSQTISRWIKQILEECGVNTAVFSAHSTRHAATSRAADKGVTLDIIKRAAGWTGESRVFANFYNRPIVNPEDFSNTVLSQ